jgi:hypothetical protein
VPECCKDEKGGKEQGTGVLNCLRNAQRQMREGQNFKEKAERAGKTPLEVGNGVFCLKGDAAPRHKRCQEKHAKKRAVKNNFRGGEISNGHLAKERHERKKQARRNDSE